MSDQTIDFQNPQIFRVSRIGGLGWPIYLVLHGIYSVLFLVMDVPPLVVFNLISSLWYIGVIALHRKKRFNAAIILTMVELTGFVIISVFCLGLNTGFHLWIFTHAIPIFSSVNWSKKGKIALMTGTIIHFFILTFVMRVTGGPILIYPLSDFQTLFLYYFNSLSVVLSIGLALLFFTSTTEQAEKALVKEHSLTRRLLLNVLPEKIADRLKGNHDVIAERSDSSTVLFADIVGFTRLSETISAEALVSRLNEIFSGFDDATEQSGLEKIKTIGDAYMAAAGVLEPVDDHGERAVRCALKMMECIDRFNRRHQSDITIRIGINSGPVIAGVIGRKKFIYDLWGSTVNLAARLESGGIPGSIQVSESTKKETDASLRNLVTYKEREPISLKGIGTVSAYILEKAKI